MKVQIEGSLPKHLMEEMQKDKPSDKASYWAKPGCKDCHGRGEFGTTTRIVGDNNKIISPTLCICASRRWKAWQEKWLEERKKANKEPQKGNGTKEISEEERFEQVRPRLERIDESILALKSKIFGLTDKIDSLPHHQIIAGFDDQIKVESGTLFKIENDMEDMLLEADQYEQKADELAQEAKKLRRAATNSHQQWQEEKAVRDGQKRKIRSLEEEWKAAEKDFNKASHSLKKKCREAEDKLDKLEKRRARIIRENGLEARINQDSTQLSDIKEETPDEEIDNQEHVG